MRTTRLKFLECQDESHSRFSGWMTDITHGHCLRPVNTSHKKRRKQSAAFLHIEDYASLNLQYLQVPPHPDCRRVDEFQHYLRLDRQHFHHCRQHRLVSLSGTIHGAHRPQ